MGPSKDGDPITVRSKRATTSFAMMDVRSMRSLMTMSCLKIIHKGSCWITACLKVPGFGFTGSSLGSLTTYTFPYFPPMACFPNPIPQLARRFRFLSHFGSHLQQSSMGFPVPQDRYPNFLLKDPLMLLHQKQYITCAWSLYHASSPKPYSISFFLGSALC
ncbi:hypothetical protein CR513_58980, partial [Mucuna pruriens]